VWALTAGQKVFISAHTRQLQDQIREAIEKAQRTGFPVRYAILKGRDNYVCWTRWQRVVDETPDPLLRAFLLAWRAQTAEGMLDEFPQTLKHRLAGGAATNADLGARLCAVGEVCDHHDPAHANCPYHNALHRAWVSHLIVVNHALLLTANWGTQTRPPLGYLVIDEAHNLEDAATAAVQADSSDRSLSGLIADCENQVRALASGSKTQGLRSIVNQLRFHLIAFGDGLVEFVRQQTYENETDERYPLRYRLRWGDLVRDAKGRWAAVKSAYGQAYQQMQALADEMAVLIDEASLTPAADRAAVGEARLQLSRLRTTIDLLDDIVNVGNANNVYWVELPARADEEPAFRWALHRAPIKVDWYLRKQLYDACQAIVFTSATLTVNGGFDFFLNRFGLERAAYRQRVHARILPSVFQTKNDILFAIPQNVGRYHPRRTAEFVERASQEVHQLLHLQPQRSLLLFNARARMQAVHALTLRPLMTLGLESSVQGMGSVQSDLEELRRDPHRVQFGVRMLWEGVDVPGMSYVIIEKLPFPLFFDPVVAARMERAKLETGSDFYGYTLPHTVIRFKQGFGRLYRRSGDRGVVVLLDRALRRASYRDIVFRSLPEHTPTSASEEELYRQIKAHFGGALTAADLLRQRTEFERSLEEYTLRQATFSRGEYDRIRPKLLAGLKAFFDFDGFIGRQEELIQVMLTGGDTLGVLPTGAGKSLTFQLPGILRDGLTLVVSPLIALMKDQVDKLRDEKGIRCVDYIVSGQAAAEQDEIMQRMVDGELRLVYVSPERFRDRRLHEALGHCRVMQFVVDEAHCVSMWGHDFRPDFLYIHDTVARLSGPEPGRGGRPPILALTATATPPVKSDIKEQLHMKVGRGNEIVDSFDRPNLRFVVQPCRTEADKERWLMRLLYRSTEPAIVYVATRRDADLIASMLRDRGIAARAYHAGMERFDRDAIQDMFMNDQIRVVVATNAFGMGVDKPDIKYVIHYHFPGDIESFYQEAGRAGRKDQIVAYSVVLYTPRDRRIQEYFIERSLPSPEVLAQLYDFLRGQPGDTLYLGDDDLAEALPFDEQALRIGMHILEREGYIRRGYDFAAGCAIKIFEPVADVLAKVEPAERRDRLAALIAALKLPDYGEKRGVNLAKLCRQIDLNPEEAELFLIELNRAEVLSFRSWERGYTVTKRPRMAATPQLALDRPALLSQVQNARARLDRMIRDYLETPDCRRVAILTYFGEQPPYEKCHKCDRCGLPEEVPWSQTFDVDLPDLYTVYHPGYVAIEAAAHFQGQYGRTKVIYTLIGQSFSPFDKKALPRGLTDSEYFKALRGYKYEQVRDFYGLLEGQGYVTKVYKEISGKQLPLIGVTEKGLHALENGDTRVLPTIG
jgi:ATP-dependent DNA helicase RecQ